MRNIIIRRRGRTVVGLHLQPRSLTRGPRAGERLRQMREHQRWACILTRDHSAAQMGEDTLGHSTLKRNPVPKPPSHTLT